MIIGATCGVFDLLHSGHIKMLSECKKRCDKLIVLLDSDESVRSLAKDPVRPIIGEEDRKLSLLSLDSVDEVIIFDSQEHKSNILKEINPDLFFKSRPYTRETTLEMPQIEAQGGEVCIIETQGHISTTAIIQKIIQSYKEVDENA